MAEVNTNAPIKPNPQPVPAEIPKGATPMSVQEVMTMLFGEIKNTRDGMADLKKRIETLEKESEGYKHPK